MSIYALTILMLSGNITVMEHGHYLWYKIEDKVVCDTHVFSDEPEPVTTCSYLESHPKYDESNIADYTCKGYSCSMGQYSWEIVTKKSE